MDTYTAARDPDQHIYLKRTIKYAWEPCTVDDILACCELPDNTLLDKEDKARMPVFGFDKAVGSTKNVQRFPTHFVILELDAPSAWKKRIQAGCQHTEACAITQTEILFKQFAYAPTPPFWWMYMTPSRCGVRFVLRTDLPVTNKEHYEQVVLSYLRLLYRITNGILTQDYHDIRIDQAWFVPVFQRGFYAKEEDYLISPLQKRPELAVDNRVKRSYSSMQHSRTTDERFALAIRFTERHFFYQTGQRNHYIHNLACNCNRLGIAQAEALVLILERYDLGEREITATTYSAYLNNKAEFGKSI